MVTMVNARDADAVLNPDNSIHDNIWTPSNFGEYYWWGGFEAF